MLKFADAETKTLLFQKLLSNEHAFADLIKSNYGHYVGITMIRTMLNQFKQLFFAHLHKNVFQYLVH
jgi:pumilio family protein 6